MLFAAEIHIGFRQRDAGNGSKLGIKFQQQINVLFDRNCEGINLVRSSPLGGDRLLRRKADIRAASPGPRLWQFRRPARPWPSTPSRLKSSEAAKPQAPSAITRMPIPCDSESDALPTLPFFVPRARLRSSTTRASAYDAPRTAAVFSAHSATNFITCFQSITWGRQVNSQGKHDVQDATKIYIPERTLSRASC